MKYPNMVIFLLTLLSSFFISCETQDSSASKEPTLKSTVISDMKDDKVTTETENHLTSATDKNFPYQLKAPVEVFEMPNKLREISGLGIDAAGTYLYAVQDEEGKLFVINTITGEVEKEKKFHKDGDYEGVEFVGDRVYAIKSSGTLYEVVNFGKETQELIKHKFDFNKNSDIEGLGYDAKEHRLLVGCKGKVGKGADFKFKKGIFSLSLDSMKMSEDPVYTISVEAVKDFLEINSALEKVDKLVKLFQPGEEFIFGPSGLAVHPKSGDIYITSSVGKLLVVINRDGDIKHLVKLKKKLHEQPEGIVFAQDGTMYISNEGKNGKGKIFKFAYQEVTE